jgi:hypothetical protein
MITAKQSTSSKLHEKLKAHCQSQYGNISQIRAAYIQGGQVYAIDYLTTSGVESIASNTAIADKVINFK